MKTILIMRHGEAEPLVRHDESRALTEKGCQQAKMMGQWLAKQAFSPEGVLISPYLRAQQTANQVLLFNSPRFLETCSDIVPNGNASFAIDYLETLISMHPDIESWLLVAHMPIVSYLVDQLSPGDMPIFQLAACAQIEYDELTRKGFLKGLHIPERVAAFQ
ncbi:phosphohistidine phosphatase SixA [Pseudoalteromonas xiamenensis]|uniref:phosphohistidine phosphatase SixA n=1 Tax=Pseudoalteromonas xiamenensis TaxID=882626 RepID=UPI0027E4EEA1|nr:phosphohistidine phosphatase SixA [Pseudoalteromonas xiamenensis]WMN60958.1 phosphohistidine phosphatase SixA [Pseudoalteromonas xiamenensis]